MKNHNIKNRIWENSYLRKQAFIFNIKEFYLKLKLKLDII